MQSVGGDGDCTDNRDTERGAATCIYQLGMSQLG